LSQQRETPKEWEQPLLSRQAAARGLDLAGYRAGGGFKGLAAAQKMRPHEAIILLRDCGLRGRGPGARPVYQKWWSFLERQGRGRLLVDAREPDPRGRATASLLQNDPWGLVEALAIAAHVFGVNQAGLRLPDNLHRLWPDLRDALAEAGSDGALGGLDLRIELEEERPAAAAPAAPAGLAARTAQQELNHALQTWYQLGLAFALGPDAYRALGRNRQAGTALITVGGAVAQPGLYEVPLGLELSDLLKAAGGPLASREVKGICLEDGLGGFLPLPRAETPLAPEELMSQKLAPSFNTLWVLDQGDCLINLTRRAMTRALNLGLEVDEASRQLTLHAIRLVIQLALREAKPDHISNLKEIAAQMERMGAAAAWALQSSLRYFPGEWRLHLTRESCAAFDCLTPMAAPCQAGCPAGIDIPSFMALVAADRYTAAVEVIRQDNPLPYICGLVCPAPCEKTCVRAGLDQPVSIRAMKAVAAKRALETGGYPRPRLAPPSGKRAAVIGAGPAGLSCAYFLTLEGHAATIFEAEDQAGGTAFSGIPAYRLPREVIQADVRGILDLGVEMRLGQKLGRDFSLQSLRDEGYDAVFLGIGATCGYRLGLPGEDDFPGQILDAVSFLKEIAQGRRQPPAEEVVVVGGGNAAMDAARTCVRLGCASVSVAYRRTRQEMPAHEEEVEEAMAEGVRFLFLVIPKGLQGEGGRLSGLQCLRAELGPADESGRRRPVPLEGSEFVLPAGAVIAAIGQKLDADCLDADCGLELSRGSRVAAQAATGQTNLGWLFAGGDAVTGPATVVEAVAAGKRAAKAMSQYLQGRPLGPALTAPRPRDQVEPIAATPTQRARATRVPMPLRQAEERKRDFAQVELGFSDQQAFEVAARCLRCDLCIGCGLCRTACAEMGAEALQFKEVGDRLAFSDFLLPSKVCMGCGACANACPTGALKLSDHDRKRRLVMTGTVLKESDLLSCSICGQPYASQIQLEKVGQRLGDRLHLRVDEHICPTCARVQQVREKWANRFLRRGAPGAPGAEGPGLYPGRRS